MRACIYIAAVLALASCTKDEDFGPVYLDETTLAGEPSPERLLIGCEGNFQAGNATISTVDLGSGKVSNGVFRAANEKGVGDVLQSIYSKGDSLFLVVNNSGVIRLVGADDFVEIREYTGFTSPRHMLICGTRALVTDLYSGYIHELNLETGDISPLINAHGWTETIVSGKKRIVVSQMDHNELWLLDREWQYEQKFSLKVSPSYVYSLPNEEWLVAGELQNSANTFMAYRYDQSFQVIDSVSMGKNIKACALLGDTLCYANNSEVTLANWSTGLLLESIDHPAETPYAMRIHPDGKRLFLTDARDFISNGAVHEIDLASGVLNTTYSVGVIPQSMIVTFASVE